jgi:multiple sugar transport system permease protein
MTKSSGETIMKSASFKLLTIRSKVWGRANDRGLLYKAVIYVLLIALGFVYLYPMLSMFATSLMSLEDLLDASVQWLPTHPTIDNYKEVMHVSETLWNSVTAAFLPAFCQTVICALTGYGLARYSVPGKKLIIALLIVTFVVPPYLLMVPNYVMFSSYKILGTLKTLVYPALMGQGTKSAIFVLVFMQFFRQLPLSLDEAARLDGAGEARIFFGIAVPLAVPAFIICFLFSFVWYWNDTYFTALYLNGSNMGDTTQISTMLIELKNFDAVFRQHAQQTGGWAAGQATAGNVADEATKMSATVITIAPLLVMFFCLQKYFVEGIERTGVTGE